MSLFPEKVEYPFKYHLTKTLLTIRCTVLKIVLIYTPLLSSLGWSPVQYRIVF